MKEKLSIKSAGLVDGKFKVVLSNGQELDHIQSLYIHINTDAVATADMKVALIQSDKN